MNRPSMRQRGISLKVNFQILIGMRAEARKGV